MKASTTDRLDPTAAKPAPTVRKDSGKWAYLATCVLALLASLALPAPAGMRPAAVRTLVVMGVTLLWWVTEALPIPVTAMMVPVMIHVNGSPIFSSCSPAPAPPWSSESISWCPSSYPCSSPMWRLWP